MNRHTTYDDWHPGELARLPDKIKRVNGARRMSLRDEIASAISKECGVDYDFTLQGQYDAADAILAKVREALLSDEAVEAAEVKYDDTWDDRTEYGDIKASITAALDAVTGEGK